MPSPFCIAVINAALAAQLSADAPHAKARQKLSGEETEVIDTVNTVFATALTEDVAKLDAVIAPGFYIFEGGSRFDGDALIGLVKSQHAAGRHTSGR